MTKQLATKQDSLPAEIANQSWGTENISGNDILIPRILLMQSGSDLVIKEKKASAGDFIGTLQNNKLGGPDKKMDFIPIYTTRTLAKYDASGKKQKFIGMEPLTSHNENLPYEDVVNGVKIKNVKNINVFCLIPSEVEQGEYLPYVLSFRNTSFSAGKKLMTLFKKLEAFKKPPASRIFSLSTFMKENDKGVFYVLDVEQKEGETPAPMMKAAYDWYKTVSAGAIKIDEDKDDESAPETTPTHPGSSLY